MTGNGQHALRDELARALREWSASLVAATGTYTELAESVAMTGSVLRPPAEEREIAAAESRLGVVFPPSHRSYLALSDGAWEPAAHMVDEANGYALLPVSQVRPFVDVDPLSVQEWTSMEELNDPDQDLPFPPQGEIVECYARLPRALHLGGWYDCQLVLVPRPDAVEWEVWNLHKEEAEGYPSFLHMLLAKTVRHRRLAAEAAPADQP